MDCFCKTTLPLTVKPFPSLSPLNGTGDRFGFRRLRRPSLPVFVVCVSRCDPGSLNTPLQPRSPTGRHLTAVLQNQRQLFHSAVEEELKLLACDRVEAVLRVAAASPGDQACLYRRITEIKQRDWQISIRDIMYAFILFKFGEIKVHLVPKLSKCIYNGRLEIWPAKDWELESIHGIDTLEMIKEHITAVIGLKANSSVTDGWAITEVQRPRLGQVYASSILYGYFLKSASKRHNLESTLALPRPGHSSMDGNYSWSNLLFGSINRFQAGRSPISEGKRPEKLQCYVFGFDKETLQRRMKVRSKEASDLIDKHTRALFGDGMTDGSVEPSDQTILTSFSSLKRLVLEAVAFGSFLWDVEEYIDGLYKLNDN
ncbi:hypothetical protein MLD38_031693 [Melastoma candidum]|uniref:Uncharacterized protein n=1 Tax=Melastoma candidum TaxID=119954 RepID=A0ACB9MTS4_9MYRT|nr:hypothetical protein MLD38_031693 [Melastoma candidum]